MYTNTSGEDTLVKSLATTIQKKLVNPTEEQFKQLDLKINSLSDNLNQTNLELRQEIDGLSEKILTIRKELNDLAALHKKTRLVAFIAITWTAINTYILLLR
ncbi:hypothetical protein [Desulfolucanica intricata]|uniref:hypothetical protein n=1 Tax=Desulfolucanica intricata TaxID=1285191 RepID=UPI0008354792|nr:hypothetical protein [Desulfolucanica intricata]